MQDGRRQHVLTPSWDVWTPTPPELLGAALATQDTNGSASFELTNTEVRLLTLLARGYTNAEIARAEHVSLRTIEGRRANLKIKLGCHGRAVLTRHALELGLLSTA